MSQTTLSAVPKTAARTEAGAPEPDAATDGERPGTAGANRGELARWRLGDWQIVGLLAVISTVFFGFAARLRYLHGQLGGDEPHYLIFNVALQKYHSLNILPVYQNRDYWSFYPALLEPHTSPGPDGQLLPLHGFGGPLLWHIPYLIFGRGGAIGFIVLVSVLTVINVYFFLRELHIARMYAGLVTLLFAVGSPIYIYSSMVFIEPIAALAVLYAVRVLVRPSLSGWRMALASAGLGIIPWVHGRFFLFSVLIGGLLLLRVYRERGLSGLRLYVQCLAPLGVLLIGYELYNLVVWGTLNPAPGNANVGNGVFQIPIQVGFLGTMLDRRFGLLTNFPLFFLVLPGILLSLRRGMMQFHGAVAVVILPYLLAISTFEAWWAGYSPPTRYIAAVAPLLAYYVAVTLQRLHHWLAIAAALLLGFSAYALALVGDVIPSLRFPPDSRSNRLMDRMGALVGIGFQKYLPNSFMWGQRKLFVFWTLVALVLAVVLWFLARRRPIVGPVAWPVQLIGRRTSSAPDERRAEAVGGDAAPDKREVAATPSEEREKAASEADGPERPAAENGERDALAPGTDVPDKKA